MNSIDFSNSIKCEQTIVLIANHLTEVMALYGIIGKMEFNELSVNSSDESSISFHIYLNTQVDAMNLCTLINNMKEIYLHNTRYVIYSSFLDCQGLGILIGLNRIDIP